MTVDKEMELAELLHSLNASWEQRHLPPNLRHPETEIELREHALYHAARLHLGIAEEQRQGPYLTRWHAVAGCSLALANSLADGGPMPNPIHWNLLSRGLLE